MVPVIVGASFGQKLPREVRHASGTQKVIYVCVYIHIHIYTYTKSTYIYIDIRTSIDL